MHDTALSLNPLLQILDDAHAIDTIVINVQQKTAITDYMVICSGRSSRHVKSMAQQLIERMKHTQLPAISSHGLENGEWALIDFGDAIVHIMQPETRAFYNLEALWQSTTG